MVGHHATSEADVTITHHLPPPEDDSTQDFSLSFAIPPQADASNLLDQNYDDFFTGPGFVTLNTPVLPRRLANTMQSVRKVVGAIQTPAVLSGPNLGQTLTKNASTRLDIPNYRAELQETHISPHSFPSLSPSTTPTGSTLDPGPPRPSDTTSKSNPDSKIYDGLISNTTPSVSGSDPSRYSKNPQDAQISRQFPTTAAQKKNKARENTSARPNRSITSKSRSGGGPNCETATRVSHVQLCQPSQGICESPVGETIRHDLG